MITLCVMLNFEGTRTDHCKALLICLALDMLYIVPMMC